MVDGDAVGRQLSRQRLGEPLPLVDLLNDPEFLAESKRAKLEIDPVSGARAMWGCPERRSEFFLAGTAPKETCPAGARPRSSFFERLFGG